MKDQDSSAQKNFPTDVYSGGRAFNAIFESKLDYTYKLILSVIASKMDFRKNILDASWSLSIGEIVRLTGLGRRTVFEKLEALTSGDNPYLVRQQECWPDGTRKWSTFRMTARIFIEYAGSPPPAEDVIETDEYLDDDVKDVQQKIPCASRTGEGAPAARGGAPAAPLNTPLLIPPRKSIKKKKEEGEKTLPLVASGAVRSPGAEIWEAYERAYRERYGVPPIRDKMANTFCKRVSETLPQDIAPRVAAFFVSHNDAYYVRTCHDLRQLACDAKKLHTEFQTGMVTGSKARQIEKSSTNRDAFLEVYKRRQARKADEEAS